MPSRKFYWLAASVFIATVLWRLPASWAIALLPGSASCEQANGRIWNGGCQRLSFGAVALSNVRWQLQGSKLWRGALGIKVQIRDPQANADGSLLYRIGGHIEGTDLNAHLGMPSALLKNVPAGFSGELDVNLPTIAIDDGVPTALQGTIQLQNLQKQQPRLELGNYELSLPENSWSNGALNGTLRDLGGPIRLNGTLTVSAAGAFELNAKLRASRRASEDISRLIEQLGPADAEGMHTASVAGTL